MDLNPSSGTLDVISICLSLDPIPPLHAGFIAFRIIWSYVQEAKGCKRQLKLLAQYVAKLLNTLDGEYREGRLRQSASPDEPLEWLQKLLNDVSTFVREQASYSFLKTLYFKDKTISQIESFNRRIASCISSLIKVSAWQSWNDQAREDDQEVLHSRLNDLEADQQHLAASLDVQHANIMAIMVSLQRRLSDRTSSRRELQFFKHSLHYLFTISGSQVTLEDWMITSYEVEFGPEIGVGGFLNSGQVFKGIWNKTEVALKVLKNQAGITPSSAAIRNEIKWYSEFLGANVLDEKPFIVMPYLANGNARDYLVTHPECDRLKLLHGISLGLVHLHSQQIVHGDLKAVNVLIDHGGMAVLCDFGLSRVKADATSRTARPSDIASIVGSRNWMSPERILGGSLKKPSDVYAFGMTLFEVTLRTNFFPFADSLFKVFAGEIPLGHINYDEFMELVVERNVRPERPEGEELEEIGLSDAVWDLAVDCWQKSENERPTANSICDTLSHLIEVAAYGSLSPITPPITPPLGSPMPAWSKRPPTRTQRSLPPHLPHYLQLPFDSSVVPSLEMSSQAPASSRPPIRRVQSVMVPRTAIPSRLVSSFQLAKVASFSDTKRAVTGVAFSRDGKEALSRTAAGTVFLWKVQTSEIRLKFEGLGEVGAVAWSPEGSYIAAGANDNTVLVWEALAGQRLVEANKKARFWSYRGRGIPCIAFSPDEEHIVFGNNDTRKFVINNIDGQTLWDASAAQHKDNRNICFTSFSPDGRHVLTLVENELPQIWDTHALPGLNTLGSGGIYLPLGFRDTNGLWTGDPPEMACFSPDGSKVIAGWLNGSFSIWEPFVKNGAGILVLKDSQSRDSIIEDVSIPSQQHPPGALAVSFPTQSHKRMCLSPDGKWVAMEWRQPSQFKGVKVWDTETGRTSATYEAPSLVKTLAFSPDSERVIFGCSDGTTVVISLLLPTPTQV
ncbi:hypothetical protein HWV62_28162 [Athelia sp. TMB]|nr:hypothetical protein HWV62_28162 [Athelia sp. TMB]